MLASDTSVDCATEEWRNLAWVSLFCIIALVLFPVGCILMMTKKWARLQSQILREEKTRQSARNDFWFDYGFAIGIHKEDAM